MSKITMAYNRLRQIIESGRIPERGRLPPERNLTAEIGVGRSTLRKALDRLEAEGLVWRHVGKGTFAGGPPQNATTGLLQPPPGISPAEVMEARLALEPVIASTAALHATDEDIAHLRQCVEKSENARTWETYELWDATLHRTVAQATHNGLLLCLLETVNSIRQRQEWGQLRRHALNAERHRLYCGQHRAFVDAIARRDAPLAAQLMQRHIAAVMQNMMTVPTGNAVDDSGDDGDDTLLTGT
jgi:GntR family transcriptional repressor for pyruvate dehydrogenase complex